MNKLIASIPAVCLLMILAVSNAAAAVVNPTYPVRVIDPPPTSVVPGAVESNEFINVFAERTQFVLPDTIAVDFTAPGTYDASTDLPATSPTVAAGTPVNSYYIFTDQVGIGSSKLFKATITFDEPVIGVMVNGTTLANSQSVLGASGTAYPSNGGGLELSGCGDNAGQDCVTFFSPSTVSIKFTTWNVTDSIRVITQSFIPVAIDIKPDSTSNCVNNNDHGVIPVAILGSATFDASLVDPGAVTLEGMAVKAVGKGDKLLASLEDVNADGYLDMVVKIQDVDGAFTDGSTVASLTGNLISGAPFKGTDSLCVVP